MQRKYINYRRKMFNQWRDKVKKHLPYFVTEFYKIHGFIDYEKHRLLGNVILGINNPFYTLIDHTGNNGSQEHEMTMEIILEINVNELFSFIKINIG